MTNPLTPISRFDDVAQYEISDRVIGGPGGTMNRAPQQLVNRTQYLKDGLAAATQTANSALAQAPRQIWPDVATGLSNTASGGVFEAVNGTSVSGYLNNAGTAVLQYTRATDASVTAATNALNGATSTFGAVTNAVSGSGLGYTGASDSGSLDAVDHNGVPLLWFLGDGNFASNVYQNANGDVRLGDKVVIASPAQTDVVSQTLNLKTSAPEMSITTRGGAMVGNSSLEFFDADDGIDGVVYIDSLGTAYGASPGYPNPDIPQLGGALPSSTVVYEGIETCDLYALDNHGQSNAQGVGENVALTTAQPYANLSFNGGVRPGNVAANMTGTGPLIEYRNPTGDQPPGGGAGETGLAAWANDLVAIEQLVSGQGFKDQVSSYFAWFGGEGGKPIGYFDIGFAGWTNWLARLQSASTVMAAAVAPTGGTYGYLVTSWQQGEADMNLTTGGATSMQGYLTLLLKIEGEIWTQGVNVAFPQQTWRPLFVIGQMCAHNTYGPTLPDGTVSLAYCNPAIAIAQWLATKQSPNIRIANPQYANDFLNQDPSTTLHMTAQGHLLQGKYFARLTRKLVADRQARRALGNYTVEMMSATVMGQRIAVTFNVPEPPLAIDTSWVQAAHNFGFELYDATDTRLDIIDSIRLAGPDTLYIHTNAAIPAGARLWAGRGITTDGKGIGRGFNATVPAGARTNLRDSAGDNDQYTGSDGVLRRLDNWCVIHYIDIG